MDTDPSTILIIDDEPALRTGLAAMIKRRGYDVVTACDGLDGMQKARDFLPDLIVSDVMMPPPNGFELRKMMAGVAAMDLTAAVQPTNAMTQDYPLCGKTSTRFLPLAFALYNAWSARLINSSMHLMLLFISATPTLTVVEMLSPL